MLTIKRTTLLPINCYYGNSVLAKNEAVLILIPRYTVFSVYRPTLLHMHACFTHKSRLMIVSCDEATTALTSYFLRTHSSKVIAIINLAALIPDFTDTSRTKILLLNVFTSISTNTDT